MNAEKSDGSGESIEEREGKMLTAGKPPKSPGSVMFLVTQLLAASRTYNQKPHTD